MLLAEFDICGREIGPGHAPYVIAEAGSNFNQSLDTAKKLIDVAADAGADAVKFQLFLADALYPDGGDLHKIFKSIELNAAWVPDMVAHARSRGLHFMASAFDRGSVDVLVRAGVPAFKVASSEAANLPLLHAMAATGKPVILATGMCDMVDVEEAVTICEGAGNHAVALLQCGAMYPLPPEQANLRVIRTFADRFGCPVGFSDHTLGFAAAATAVGLGATVFEKHFTLDKKSEGPDHFYAAEPDELKRYVATIHEAFAALGGADKQMLAEERRVGRREGLYAARALEAGAVLTSEDIAAHRPAAGLRARYRAAIVGARLTRAVAAGEPITWEHLSF